MLARRRGASRLREGCEVSVRTIAVLLIRIVALWVFIHSISGLAALFPPADDEHTRHAMRLAVLVGSLLPMAVAFIVWSNADWLGARAAHGQGEEGGTPWFSADLERAAVAIVGVVVLTQSIPEMAWYGSLFMSLGATKSTFLGPVPVSDAFSMRARGASASSLVPLVDTPTSAPRQLPYPLMPPRAERAPLLWALQRRRAAARGPAPRACDDPAPSSEAWRH